MTSRLGGRRLMLTRSTEDSSEWAEALAAEGAQPIVLPCIEIEAPDDPDLERRAQRAVAQADWIVFTSRRGVDALADLVSSHPATSARLAGVGAATADRIRERFGRIDLVGSGTAGQLAAELETSIEAGDRCVLALAANAGDTLERTLTEAGATVTRLDVYRTVPSGRVEPKRALSTIDCDTVIFASPSAVTGFDNQVDVDTARHFVTIGPSTSAAVRRHDWDVSAEAREPSLSGIIESILETDHV